MKRPPRYDLPHAAPEPLRLVQLFVNTTEHEHGLELLGNADDLRAWLAARNLPAENVGPAAVRRAHELREALRTLIAEGRVTAPLEEAAERARLTVELRRPGLVPQAAGIDGALGAIVAVAYDAMRDGSWARLKTCRNCHWAFWDESRNRSAQWCSMQLCGNRLKLRRHRAKQRGASTRSVPSTGRRRPQS
jgi:predicted RNA-binding Zn ribbon-like protein